MSSSIDRQVQSIGKTTLRSLKEFIGIAVDDNDKEYLKLLLKEHEPHLCESSVQTKVNGMFRLYDEMLDKGGLDAIDLTDKRK